MNKILTEVLVIGGGATGTGIVRDLAMRGFKTALVERRDLSHGTTGRYHGLLHSGGRYVVKDPQAAHECIEENRILRRIMPGCIEDTGGFFVVTPWDDPAYGDRFVAGCKQAGIPVEEVPIKQMLREEPRLNPEITRCLRVPDASADSFAASDLTAWSARQHGAEIFTYHEVRRLVRSGNRVTGAVCYDLVNAEEVEFSCDMVVNASGAWAGKIAASAGLEVQIKPGKGTMVAVNQRIVNTVINRCKMPADGDILVPAHTVAVMGTTDEHVIDPDKFSIEPWEIQLMLDEGEKIIPGFKDLRMLRAWAGVRPLYQETAANASRDITRAYVLLDHAVRDGVEGLVTMTSGKWTTHRKMAEATVDTVCKKLHVQRPCRTAQEVMEPETGGHGHGRGQKHHQLGARLAAVEKDKAFGSLICECELATQAEVEQAIRGGAKTIDDIRRDTRLGMGPCQGGFCTLRAAGLLHELNPSGLDPASAAEASASALRDYLQERWKGLLPVLWGQQLRQERLDELIYLNVLNLNSLPGETLSRLGPEDYTTPGAAQAVISQESAAAETHPAEPAAPNRLAVDLLVIGAGLAGLASAWFAARQELKTRLISKGWGALYWASGCLDVLGSTPDTNQPLLALRSGLESLVKRQPEHPYALTGLQTLAQALGEVQALCSQAGYPLLSADPKDILGSNWLLPTTLGSLRPTCLAPLTMTAGDCRTPETQKPIVLVGIEGFLDFSPGLAAANLQSLGIPARGVKVSLAALEGKTFLTSRVIAEALEAPKVRAELSAAIKAAAALPDGDGFSLSEVRIGLPGVLGMQPSYAIWQDLHDQLGCPVFELAGLPPSLPGIRLHRALVQAIQAQQGQVFDGMQVLEAVCQDDRVTGVYSEAAARPRLNQARQFILASGGFLGGGFHAPAEKGLREVVFDLPLTAPASRADWFRRQFLAPEGHPLFQSGVRTDQRMQPLNENGLPVYHNLYAVGGVLAAADPLREHSLEGIAIASAYAAVQAAVQAQSAAAEQINSAGTNV